MENETLNDSYIPRVGDIVKPLPRLSSNKLAWNKGVVTKVFEDPFEVWIDIEGKDRIIEYANYVEKVIFDEDKPEAAD